MKEKVFSISGPKKHNTYMFLSLHKMERVFAAREVGRQILRLQSFHRVLLIMSEGFPHLSSIFYKAKAERADILVNQSNNNSTVFSSETVRLKLYLWNSAINKYCNCTENFPYVPKYF